MIVKNELLLAEVRAKSHCEWCLRWCPGELDCNHIFCRGMGGGNRLDVRVNLVALCRWCHADYHAGRISRRQLLELVAHRERMTVEEIVAEIYRLRREPKETAMNKKLTVDLDQGINGRGEACGYVTDGKGGYFFDWKRTLKETLNSLNADETDKPDFSADDARKALKAAIKRQAKFFK